MWRRAVQVQRRCASGLLLGDMQESPRLRGLQVQRIDDLKDRRGRSQPPLEIDTVQASAWLAGDGSMWYALANVSDASAAIKIEVGAASVAAAAADVVRIDHQRRDIVARDLQLPKWLDLRLAPYEVLCLKLETGTVQRR